MKLSLLLSLTVIAFPPAQSREDVSERLGNAAEVFGELLNAPDADVPEGLLEDADCVAVIPDVRRAALGFGGQSGRGAASCRTESGWSAPSMLALDGGSIGFQIGVSSSDVVLLFMADDSIRHLTGGEVTLGGDASVAAGPKGRDAGANTNLTFEAEILSYSRSRGVFAGISIEGASMRPDDDANEVLYGREVEAGEVLRGGMPVPEMAAAFIEALRSH
jgi:lipid-binding SYLF domain-containing protein